MDSRRQFQELLHYSEDRTGFALPTTLHEYLVELLDSRLYRTDLIPDPSFAERWLMLNQTPTSQGFKEFADQCLFFTSLMPEWGQRRGISMDYYCTLGISSYYSAGDLAREDCYTQLGNWFYHIQRFLAATIRPDQRLAMYKF